MMQSQADDHRTGCATILKVGDVLNGKWVILNFIDKGGMGEVYRAHQTNLDRDVAIKIISRQWLESLGDDDEESETMVRRFRREVKAMAQISHPNVLQVFDHDSVVVENCDRSVSLEYIAMEFIPGGCLRDTMSEEGFYPDEDAIREWVKTYFLPVLSGVVELHAKSIVHRDLKPENILMDRQTAKIADFGLARSGQLKPVTKSIDVKGSPYYMSPEHFFDFKRTDQRADVYCLGKILYEAVAGKIQPGTPPFKKASLPQSDAPFLKELDQIIQAATAEDKNERTKSAAELVRQLERLVQGMPVNRGPVGKITSLLARPRWIWSGIVTAVMAVAAMTIWHVAGQPRIDYSRDVDKSAFVRPQIDRSPDIAGEEKSSQQAAREHLGKEVVVKGGRFDIPPALSGGKAPTVQLSSFYLDEFFVTNQQFVDFLNHNLGQIDVEGGVVKSRGDIWFLLGMIRPGYEPIVLRSNEFHVSNPGYSASPVLRVTGYGARAYARYFNRRLPTGLELLYVMAKEKGNAGSLPDSAGQDREPMMHMMGRHPEEGGGIAGTANGGHESKIPAYLLTAASFSPNLLGIKGLNSKIGQWVDWQQLDGDDGPQNNGRMAVIGGIEDISSRNYPPAVIKRYAWEGFEEVGFRTAAGVR